MIDHCQIGYPWERKSTFIARLLVSYDAFSREVKGKLTPLPQRSDIRIAIHKCLEYSPCSVEIDLHIGSPMQTHQKMCAKIIVINLLFSSIIFVSCKNALHYIHVLYSGVCMYKLYKKSFKKN